MTFEEAKVELDLFYTFWEKFNYLGEIAWSIELQKITIEFYFDRENVVPELILHILNEVVKDTPKLLECGWKPNFKLTYLKPQFDWTKRVCFCLSK